MFKNNCVLLITHKQNKDIQRYIDHIERESDGLMDFYVLYDCANSNPKTNLAKNVYVFNSQLLEGFFYGQKTLIPNPLLIILNFVTEKHYDHYLVMEFDIVLKGGLREFLNKVNSIKDIDYIHIGYDEEGAPEKHWPIKYIKNNPFRKLYFSWCHVLYVSYEFLTDVKQFMSENDSFYYEFLLPTMAYNGNYMVKQFENLGYQFNVSWGPVDKYETMYKEDVRINTFYHPIKDLSIVTFK